MKKFGLLFIVAVLCFSQIVPVMAKSEKPGQRGPDLTIWAPSSAYTGDTIDVSISVSSLRKIKNDWVIVFPKSSVGYVFGPGNIPVEQDSDNWYYRWNYNLEKSGLINISFRMNLIGQSGNYSLLKVYDGRRVVAEQSIEVVVRPPLALDWSISTPKTVVSGGRPFSVFITVANPNPSTEMSFDVAIQVLFPATNKSVYPIVRGGTTYKAFGDENSYTLYWRGTVPARSNFQINLGLASGNTGGTFDLINMYDLLDNKVWKSIITVVAPVEPPHGELRLTPFTVKPGDLVLLEGEFFASESTQFVIKGYQSTCPIEGLPGEQESPSNLSYFHTNDYVTILSFPELASGVNAETSTELSAEVDSLVVTSTPPPALFLKCNLSVTFFLWNHPETIYTAYGYYEVRVN